MSYQLIDEIFENYDSTITAAEAHGIAAAMLCVDNRADAGQWLAEMFADEIELSATDRQSLLSLFEQTRILLDAEQSAFEFDLFFPDDDDFHAQLSALSSWCQGFLWGIGYSHSGAHWLGETDGILKDMVEITKLNSDIEEENEESTAAFMHLHQYLRAAVLMIRDELATAGY
jgi:uncharacterized protein